jgi:hypothetical protein
LNVQPPLALFFLNRSYQQPRDHFAKSEALFRCHDPQLIRKLARHDGAHDNPTLGLTFCGTRRFPHRLLESDAESRQQPLQNCGETDQCYENFEQVSQPAIADKPVDQIKANRTNDNNDQDVYQNEKHDLSPIGLLWRPDRHGF